MRRLLVRLSVHFSLYDFSCLLTPSIWPCVFTIRLHLCFAQLNLRGRPYSDIETCTCPKKADVLEFDLAFAHKTISIRHSHFFPNLLNSTDISYGIQARTMTFSLSYSWAVCLQISPSARFNVLPALSGSSSRWARVLKEQLCIQWCASKKEASVYSDKPMGRCLGFEF